MFVFQKVFVPWNLLGYNISNKADNKVGEIPDEEEALLIFNLLISFSLSAHIKSVIHKAIGELKITVSFLSCSASRQQ